MLSTAKSTPAPPQQLTPDQIFHEFHTRYMHQPVLFAREMLEVEPDPWQCDLLMAVATGKRRITVRSGHGVGKTSVVAWCCIWYILTRIPVKIVITAPNASQLFDALFAEIKVWIEHLPAELKDRLNAKSDRIELKAAPDESFISARTSKAETPEALAGVHSKNVLLIADEASGIPEAVFVAAYGSMSGHSATTVLLGNPIRTSGMFYETHTNEALGEKWHRIHVSCLDSKRVSREFVNDIIALYGIESNHYRVRVLGEFPRAEDDTVIPLELVETAINRDVQASPTSPIFWGVDVARFGNDASCLAKRHANVITEAPRIWRNLDLMQTASMIKAEWDATGADRRPVEILVDAIGQGAGVCDRLREFGLPARGINVSESPSTGTTYLNLRAELWFKARAWLERRDCRLPGCNQLRDELCMVRYGFQPNSSKMKVESKDDIRRRAAGRSPDMADAFTLTFASEAGTAMYGASYASSWSRPMPRRNLSMV